MSLSTVYELVAVAGSVIGFTGLTFGSFVNLKSRGREMERQILKDTNLALEESNRIKTEDLKEEKEAHIKKCAKLESKIDVLEGAYLKELTQSIIEAIQNDRNYRDANGSTGTRLSGSRRTNSGIAGRESKD